MEKNITANQYEVLRAIDKNFDGEKNYILVTMEDNIIPNLPSFLKIGKSTLYSSINKLRELGILKYNVIDGKGYSMIQGKNYYKVINKNDKEVF